MDYLNQSQVVIISCFSETYSTSRQTTLIIRTLLCFVVVSQTVSFAHIFQGDITETDSPK